MAIPLQRDPDKTGKALLAWLAEQVPEGREFSCTGLAVPEGTGFSNETLMFDVDWREGTARRSERLVVRVRPTRYRVFYEDDFALQYRILQFLGEETDVPVPKVRWFEPDSETLGAPFFVMDRVDGRAFADNPPYDASGWVCDATPAERHTLWENAIAAMAKIHRVPAEKVLFLSKPERGATGFEQQLQYAKLYLDWAAAGRSQPIPEAAWEWLLANPPQAQPTALSWGDSRLGNILFGPELDVRAVVDWEMVSLGGPLQDLGWWLFFDETYLILSGQRGVARLPGLGDREETIAAWSELTGQSTADLFWYEVFAGLRYSLVMLRLVQLLFATADRGSTDVRDREVNNPVTHALARLLDIAPPGPIAPWG